MRLKKLLELRKRPIIDQWFERVIKSYAPDTAQFIKNQKDPFSNPFGSVLSKGLAVLFDQLLTNPDSETVKRSLDPIIRIRAVQDYSPSQATAFILILKNIVRENIKNELQDSQTANELLQFESKIDALSLVAFDIYMACKEKIYDLKTNTERNKVYKAFERAGLLTETSEPDPGLQRS
ncbi:MAG: RsbRD N-terminal domain-containing protein [Deltaproteobacteria bacterium]|nr:MAG: RsbRD N-terminal domain-containing protein [Deltaproteobacteria bacterium]